MREPAVAVTEVSIHPDDLMDLVDAIKSLRQDKQQEIKVNVPLQNVMVGIIFSMLFLDMLLRCLERFLPPVN